MFTVDPRLPRFAARIMSLGNRRSWTTGVVDGVLGVLDDSAVDTIVSRLDRDGYIVFDETLSPELVDTLSRELSELPAYAALTLEAELDRSEPLDRGRLRASRYDHVLGDLISIPELQTLVVDPTLGAIADAYLHRNSILTSVTAWRSMPFGASPSSTAAQLFHSDRDHLRFLKFFLYLTDVTTTTGPHVFVRGSHRRRPADLRRDVRFSDEEVLGEYPERDLVELCGPAGTIMAVDTSGLHKGKLPTNGERLIVQFEFGSSQFGTPVSEVAFEPASADVARRIASNPRKFAMLACPPDAR
jgi:hypothetical protein